MHVIVADDCQLSCELVSAALQADGHTVSCAADGIEAFTQLQQSQSQVLISDWEMPNCDGLELCKKVRGANLGRYIYIIMLTSREGTANLVQGLSAGADDFLSKPFDPAELSVRMGVAARIAGLESRDLTIFAMARLAESRDQETGAHLERTRAYCKLLAQQMATMPGFQSIIDDEFIATIYATSPLHDIGKVGVPDAVLLKPGQLTAEEYHIMQRHVQIGAETLEAVLRQNSAALYLRMARDIAWAHHERYDGTGYPRGLKGDEIPLPARIMALADVYDALRSRRVYKDGLTHETTKAMIQNASGTHFDPRVVQAFMACSADFQAISLQLVDEQPARALHAAA